MLDTMAAMVFHGALTRFPNLNILAVEGGAHWVGELMKQMDKSFRGGRGSKLAPKLPDWPSKILAERLYVTPFHEEDVVALAKAIPVEQIILGSDYPHPEGLAHPAKYVEKLKPLGPAATKAIMGENLARAIGIWNV
jgi:predicted TIM-barrel fold metal-dependent hydrolase